MEGSVSNKKKLTGTLSSPQEMKGAVLLTGKTPIDTSLTKEGYAADAKATGEAISRAKSEAISSANTYATTYGGQVGAEAKIYADGVGTSAKNYADNVVSVASEAADNRFTNLEKAIAHEPFATDNSTAYTKVVPENTLPSVAEVSMLGGMSRKCKNLLYPSSGSTTTNGVTFTVNGDKSITISGTATNNIYYYLCEVVLDAGSYTISGVKAGNDKWGSLYDDTHLLLASNATQPVQSATITEKHTCKFYISVGNGKTVNETIYPMLNEGTTAIPYEPYFGGLASAKVTEVESLIGKNLFDYNAHVSNGNVSIIPIVPNKTLYRNGQIGGTASWEVYDATDTLLGTFASYGFSSSTPFVVPSNAAYIKTTDNATYLLSSLYIGYDSNTEYEPCVKCTLPIPESVQAIDGYGDGIDDTCYNYIDFEKKQFVKRVGKVDLGTLNWYMIPNYGKYRVFYNEIGTVKPAGMSLCSIYDCSESIADFSNHDKSIYLGNINAPKSINVIDSAYTDEASFKSAMSGVMLYYELATPEIIDISDILPNSIEVEGGGTITFKNEHELAMPSDVDYYAQTKGVTLTEANKREIAKMVMSMFVSGDEVSY